MPSSSPAGKTATQTPRSSGKRQTNREQSRDGRLLPLLAGATVRRPVRSPRRGNILGRPAIRGISLGSVVCIIFVGLLVSIGSYTSTGVALALPDVVKTIFFNIFIFALGVKIGPQFFAGLKRDGWHMVAIGATVAVLAPVISYAFGWLFELPPGAVAGLLAGSNNSSATFGTASSALSVQRLPSTAGRASVENVAGMLSAAFALCYAATQVQFVLFMKVLPKLAGFDAPKSAREFEAAMRGERMAPLPGTVEAADALDSSVAVRAYRVPEGRLATKTIGDIRRLHPAWPSSSSGAGPTGSRSTTRLRWQWATRS